MRDSIFLRVFKRGEKSSSVGLWLWLKLILLEAYLGEQLVEMLSVTAAFSEGEKGINFGGGSSNGAKEPLNFFYSSYIIQSNFAESHN